MKRMHPIVKYPVYDLDNTLLVEAGTELSPAFMAELCGRNGARYPTISLLEHGRIRQDLLHQFSIPPYDVIFSDPATEAAVLGVMERVTLPLPILEIMDYFRQYDFHTYRHMLMIAALSTLLLNDLDPRDNRRNPREFDHFGPFHDVGKYSIPLRVLLKKTPLTSAELDFLRHHTVGGYVLLSHYLQDHGNLAAAIALDHHERRNGSGYSRGISQHNLAVEVTAVCDIYDALIAQRPYRPIPYDNRTAIEELTWMAQRGEIGWEAVQLLVAYNRRAGQRAGTIEISLERRGKAPVHNVYGQLADGKEEFSA
jgi:HD-GYP domain-containing protein (c-di-GMP phosphodiesterase class II)